VFLFSFSPFFYISSHLSGRKKPKTTHPTDQPNKTQLTKKRGIMFPYGTTTEKRRYFFENHFALKYGFLSTFLKKAPASANAQNKSSNKKTEIPEMVGGVSSGQAFSSPESKQCIGSPLLQMSPTDRPGGGLSVLLLQLFSNETPADPKSHGNAISHGHLLGARGCRRAARAMLGAVGTAGGMRNMSASPPQNGEQLS